MIDEAEQAFEIPAIRLTQPMGDFFIASIPHDKLVEISFFDVRRMLKERDFETYLGIQRPLNKDRTQELKQYVRTMDACFPTGIVLAVDGRCASFNEETGKLTLSNYMGEDGGQVLYRQIARVLDGQHRIAGLEDFPKDRKFDLNVSIFVDIELEDQAYIFSIVNISQTKVNKSLVYDLYELSQSRSPQRTAHNIAIGLDRAENSPLFHRIKRLGAATPGRERELLTQATVVESILPLITRNSTGDRDTLKRLGAISTPSREELKKMPLRGLFAEDEDVKIYEIIKNYISAVADRWAGAWSDSSKGAVLSKTNGYRAIMRVFPQIYLSLAKPGEPVAEFKYRSLLDRVKLEDADFHVDNFPPGSSGEAKLANTLLVQLGLSRGDGR
ncbi:DGQHR domain-containing protein [Achromobacter sp. Marseille-Q4954]|uniref:DGQHR domain-containing protein n=1 Tax=Achromobacter sp. Marseille-Q4954 TaxID=2942203 RepID=UPI002072D1D4|nr:DGQHR domain-containing protein [Achromobacter sp. Marseille-Q4954]